MNQQMIFFSIFTTPQSNFLGTQDLKETRLAKRNYFIESSYFSMEIVNLSTNSFVDQLKDSFGLKETNNLALCSNWMCCYSQFTITIVARGDSGVAFLHLSAILLQQLCSSYLMFELI